MLRLILAALILLQPIATEASRRESLRAPIEGPVEAILISVIDGDTLLVEAKPWPQHSVTVLVRIRGIDAPELKAKCADARRNAERAKERLTALAHGRIRLTNISGDKYFGRVIADVTVEDAENLGALLLAQGLVSAYDGGRRIEQGC
jgi:endonuclease YncB( thermonuclease family)